MIKRRLSNGNLLIIELPDADQEYIDAMVAVAEEAIMEVKQQKAVEESEDDVYAGATKHNSTPRRRGRR